MLKVIYLEPNLYLIRSIALYFTRQLFSQKILLIYSTGNDKRKGDAMSDSKQQQVQQDNQRTLAVIGGLLVLGLGVYFSATTGYSLGKKAILLDEAKRYNDIYKTLTTTGQPVVEALTRNDGGAKMIATYTLQGLTGYIG